MAMGCNCLFFVTMITDYLNSLPLYMIKWPHMYCNTSVVIFHSLLSVNQLMENHVMTDSGAVFLTLFETVVLKYY